MKDIRMKNKFKKLAEKLINNTLWKSEVTLIQLNQIKSGNKITFEDGLTRVCNCVIKDIVRKTDDAKFDRNTVIYIAAEELAGFTLDKSQLSLMFNGHRYELETISLKGQLNNEECVVEFIIRK